MKHAAIQALDWLDNRIFQHGILYLSASLDGTHVDKAFYALALWWNQNVCYRIANSKWWPEN